MSAPSRRPGDRDHEFREFFATEYPATVSFLWKIGFAGDSAHDAAAEAMVELYRRWPVKRNPRAWVRTAAYRVALRSKSRAAKPITLLSTYRAPARDGTDAYLLVEEALELRQVLAELPRQQRIVISLGIDGFTTGEIADILTSTTGHQIQEATVRSHLRHAKAALKKIITAREEVSR